MDHYKPHRNPTFEGYYTRFHLSTGGSIIVILCGIAKPVARPYNCIVTYVPPSGPIWQSEVWPAHYSCESQQDGVVIKASGSADPKCQDSTIDVNVHSAGGVFDVKIANGFHLHAELKGHVPWSETSSSPEGMYINLPLPLHWHVLSTLSPAEIALKLPASASVAEQEVDAEGYLRVDGTAHLEKNWAHSFPAAHTWVQGLRVSNPPSSSAPTASPSSMSTDASARPTTHTLALAGGPILGITAHLLGYRNPSLTPPLSIDLLPPFTLDLTPLLAFLPLPHTLKSSLRHRLAPILSPFTSTTRDWDRRTLTFSFADLTRKLEIEVAAPEESFFNFGGPYPGGFKDKWMAQSLRGKAWVRASRRVWAAPWSWEVLCEDWFEDVGMEFGGEYYPNRGVGEGRAQ